MEEKETNKAVFSIKSLLGVFLILLSIAGFLGASRGVADNQIAVILTYIFTFPVLYLGGFVGYWFWTIILLSLGVIIAIFRRRIKAKSLIVTFLGIIIIYFAALLFASMLVKSSFLNKTSSGFITYNYKNGVTFFNEIMFDNPGGVWTNRNIESLMLAYRSGGGLIGFFFSSLIATVGDFLVYIVVALLTLGGTFLTFRKTIINIFKKENVAAKEKDHKDGSVDVSSEEENNVETLVKDNKTVSLYLENNLEEPTNEDADLSTSKEEYPSEEEEMVKYYEMDKAKNDELNDEKEFEYQLKSYNKLHGLSKASFEDDLDLDEEINTKLEHKDIENQNNYSSSFEKENIQEEMIGITNTKPTIGYQDEINDDEEDEYIAEEVSYEESHEEDFSNYLENEEENITQVIKESSKEEIVIPEVYNYPSVDLLSDSKENIEEIMLVNEKNCEERITKIDNLFRRQRIDAFVDGYTIGPCITRFNVAYGETGLTKHVKAIEKDISRVLGGYKVRFEEYVLGQETSGLEIANEKRMTVSFKECFAQLPPRNEKNKTMICLGKDISGKYINANINKGPHLLVAGTTGSGKSVFMNSLITTLIMRNSPKEVRLIMVDPKRVEMVAYQDLPHLLCPIITDPYKAKSALDKLVKEMDMRYDEFAKHRVNEIKSYNTLAKTEGFEEMPTIICFIDEFADLIENCKDVARPVSLLGAKSRACGIHLVLATQRPTTNIISGTIKGNLPFRVALSVNTGVDSSVILDQTGAECLLGNGDMLVMCGEVVPNELIRCQGSYLSDEERDLVVNNIKEQWPTVYDDFYMNLEGEPKDNNAVFENMVNNATSNAIGGVVISKADALMMDDEVLYKRIKDVAMSRDFISKSYIQSTFNVGFNRAGRMINRLAEEQVISSIPEPGAKGFRVILRQDYSQSENPGSEELITTTYTSDDNE